jgi:GAF domain-containing protein/HAMP domain-containing protein
MFNSLRARFTIILIGLAIGPLLIAGLILVQRSLATETARAYNLQSQVAQNVATAIEAYIQGRVTDLTTLGNDIRGLGEPDRAQQLSLMLSMLSSGPNQDAYEELILLDENGRERVRLSSQEIVPSNELGNRSGTEEYQIPNSTRKTYFSPVRFDGKTGKVLITIAIPLYEPRSVQLKGVLIANIDFASISKLLSQAQVGADQVLYVTDPAGGVVAHQNRGLNIQGLTIKLPEKADTQRGLDGTNVVLAVRLIQLENQRLFVVAEQPNSQALQLAYITILTTSLVVIFAIAFAIAIAFVAVRQIVHPIQSLAASAERIASGDLIHKAEIIRKDEIGLLAMAFNSMTGQLRDLFSTLEKRVADRTAEVESARQLSDERAQELQTIVEIARYISIERDLEKLLPLITNIVSDRFGFYHVGIFLLDQTRKYAVLRASNSLGGQEMLKRQHRLEVGQTGIVGNVTGTGTPRIALDTGADAIFFNNPDLPETRSEMALPLSTRGTIIGALDVQSTTPNAFTDSDASILGLLADQLAIAIDNVRLIDETQNALSETQSIFRDYLAEAWQKKSTSEILGYHQTLTGGQLITGEAIQEIDIPSDTEKDTLAIPIRLRDQVIGTLNVRPNNDGRTWSVDEINIVQAVAERLGLALDNARLFEETSSRASRERLVSDITTKIRGTNDPQEMIKTAVEELKRALGATRVEVVPKTNALPPDK